VQLSLHADYGLRALLYLAAHPGKIVATQEISDAYGISKHHLVRVMQTLGDAGYVRVIPGRAGGVTLARDADTIHLGDVVRDTEPNLHLVECFDRDTNTCPIVTACELKRSLSRALQAFIAELNKQTIADLLASQRGRKLSDVFVQLRV
jgi:Rrf2 family nitric oxide-sensitive transcriptional repressor